MPKENPLKKKRGTRKKDTLEAPSVTLGCSGRGSFTSSWRLIKLNEVVIAQKSDQSSTLLQRPLREDFLPLLPITPSRGAGPLRPNDGTPSHPYSVTPSIWHPFPHPCCFCSPSDVSSIQKILCGFGSPSLSDFAPRRSPFRVLFVLFSHHLPHQHGPVAPD